VNWVVEDHPVLLLKQLSALGHPYSCGF